MISFSVTYYSTLNYFKEITFNFDIFTQTIVAILGLILLENAPNGSIIKSCIQQYQVINIKYWLSMTSVTVTKMCTKWRYLYIYILNFTNYF